jgi:hypothetical protein
MYFVLSGEIGFFIKKRQKKKKKEKKKINPSIIRGFSTGVMAMMRAKKASRKF